MSLTKHQVETKSTELDKPEQEVVLTIDGIEVSVPKGTLVIRAAEKLGIAIPRFCDHPLLDPVGACRQCMVEIPDAGNGRGFPKPQASCTIEAAPGMKVNTQLTSESADRAQRGILELILINHPLDCPICDKGGECPLQNQSMAEGKPESRYQGAKRTYPKPVSISANILLDRERCVLCARCTRFSEQISGDPFITLVERGALQQVGLYQDQPYNSYFSGNVVQICPVGALTSAAYRFQARPFDLVSVTTTCENCAAGCLLRVDSRHNTVRRRLAGEDASVNEEWNCDRGRFGFVSGRGDDRLTQPLVRRNGVLEPASWPEAIDAAVAGLRAANGSVGVLTGGRITMETAYGYAKFARMVLGTNSIDFRSRPSSKEEADFLAARVAGRGLAESVTYSDIEKAKQVVLVAFEPEDESPILFLRLRKAVRRKGLKVSVLAPFLSAGSRKLNAELVSCAPGEEASELARLNLGADTIILVGERAATLPGTLSAVVATGARFAWVPRRAGEVGAVEAGCLPDLLPGGRPLADPSARVDVATHWGTRSLPTAPGRSAEEQFRAAAEGSQRAFLIAGTQIEDFADPAAVIAGLDAAKFVVSIEQRANQITERADVVFPVALLEESSGSFVNWEHRVRPVNRAVRAERSPMTDLRVLGALADALEIPLGFRSAGQAWADYEELGAWEGERARFVPVAPAPVAEGMKLASWRLLLDSSACLDGEENLAKTAPTAVARLSRAWADQLGASVKVIGPRGTVELPVEVAEMADDVIWLPTNSGVSLSVALGVLPGGVVEVSGGTK